MKLKIKFTIASRLGLGFGILLIAILITSFLTYKTLDENIKANDLITNIYSPSVSKLHELHLLISNSKILLHKETIEVDDSTVTKDKLIKWQSKEYPLLKQTINTLMQKWNKEDQKRYYKLLLSIDTLFELQQSILNTDNTSQNDTNQNINNSALIIVELTSRIENELTILVTHNQQIVSQSNKKMEIAFGKLKRLVLVIAIILVINIILIGIFITNSLISPIKSIKRIILLMSKGVLPENKIKSRSDEIGEMADALNLLISGLKKTSEFSLEIGKGNYNYKFTPLSENDVLGNSLQIMQENLIKANIDENIRKEENAQRNWIAQGLAMFGEILRQSNENMTEFAFDVVKNIVKYLNINQGGLFLITNENKNKTQVKLCAAFAYERRKNLQKTIDIDEGLIGRCIIEKDTIYITEIPDGYINIVSGLGNSNPRSLLIVPMITNDEVIGAIELASFSELPAYKIKFVEKLSEIIASTFRNVSININTSKLLKESQEKSEKLAEKEEELKQKKLQS